MSSPDTGVSGEIPPNVRANLKQTHKISIMKAHQTGKFAAIILASLLLIGCAEKRENNPDLGLDLSNELWLSYSDLLKEGNPESIANKFTRNASIIYPNIPDIVGKENILGQLRLLFPNISMQEFDFEIKNVCFGDSTLSNFISVKEKYLDASGDEYNSDARITTFWKLEADGEWRIDLFQVNYKR